MTQMKELAKYLIHEYYDPSSDFRSGKMVRAKNILIDQDFIDGVQIGFQELSRQAAELEQAGIITAVRKNFELCTIRIQTCAVPALYHYAGLRNPLDEREHVFAELRRWRADASADWLVSYYNEQIASFEKGNKTPKENAEKKDFYQCLNAVVSNDHDIWKRKFSEDVLGDSKRFEGNPKKKIPGYEKSIITILKKCPYIEDTMTDAEVLAEFGIMTYSQTLELKGSLQYVLDDGTAADTAGMKYGVVINAQTLSHASVTGLRGIRKIITIENKANYEAVSYDPEILYLYTHGFFSPKERKFLEGINAVISSETAFLHWSDLDYGGFRIFQFIRKEVFPLVKPLHMTPEDYRAALLRGYGIPLDPDKRMKLEKIDVPELADLKACILMENMEIEQEALI